MSITKKLLIIVSIPVGLGMIPAKADYTYMGHCTDDPSVSSESVISACVGFISRALQESWQMEDIPLALSYEASAYERTGNYDKAEETLKVAVTKYPYYTPAWENLARLLVKLKGPGMFEGTIDAMLHANPGNASVLTSACWMRATRGEQLDAAIADCNAALQLKPGVEGYLDSRALAEFRKGQYAQAITDANAALAKDPKMATPLYVRGLAKQKSGDAAGGQADIAAAKAMDAKIAQTYAAYGVAP